MKSKGQRGIEEAEVECQSVCKGVKEEGRKQEGKERTKGEK